MLTRRIRRLIARTLGPLVFLFTLGRVEVDRSGEGVSSQRDDGPPIMSTATPGATPPPGRGRAGSDARDQR